MLEKIYQEKELNYFTTVRTDLISFIKDEKGLIVLEIGAGTGNTLRHLKKKGIASEIHLIDIIDLVDCKEDFDSIRILDVESTEISEKGKYDIIILADVLEHLKDTETAIKQFKELLKENGRFLISLPNIRHFSSIKKIFFRGSFQYEDSGLFDRTHFRFFCKSDMIALFNGYSDLKIKSVTSINDHLKSKMTLLNTLTFGFFCGFLSLQYILEVEKKSVLS